MGATPESTAFPTLAMDNVVPSAFAETWENDMDSWGSQIKSSAEGVMRMLSIGLGLKEGALLECSQFGPHLLGPTSIDLSQSGQVGNIFAGFHTDLNFISLHGASRYPGKVSDRVSP
jgi:isopenicillin N synthase-like dioxygenase